LEAWEKVLITGPGSEEFFASKHGSFSCTACHKGRGEDLPKEDAHQGMVARPSEDPRGICKDCHLAEYIVHERSLHMNLWGEKNLLAKRYGVDDYADLPTEMQEGFQSECAKCHASCGDCHVTRPVSVGSGLVAGHRFGAPDMTENCTACHGSRVGMEYRGENEGVGADVHYVPQGMQCIACHTKQEMHGTVTVADHRLDVRNGPKCEDCHDAVAAGNDYHTEHWGELACQTCHSQDYKSCNSCHAGSGLAEPSYLSFKIGRNPVPEKRSAEFVVLRHAPVAEDTYREWGAADLPTFASEPTWKYAAPHNIKRWTSRTKVEEGESCGTACHGSPDGPEGVFLRQADLDAMTPAEAEANRDLIVPNGSPVNW